MTWICFCEIHPITSTTLHKNYSASTDITILTYITVQLVKKMLLILISTFNHILHIAQAKESRNKSIKCIHNKKKKTGNTALRSTWLSQHRSCDQRVSSVCRCTANAKEKVQKARIEAGPDASETLAKMVERGPESEIRLSVTVHVFQYSTLQPSTSELANWVFLQT